MMMENIVVQETIIKMIPSVRKPSTAASLLKIQNCIHAQPFSQAGRKLK